MPDVGHGVGRWPSHIAVIGGGRWARVMLDVLCAEAPPDTVLSAHSQRGTAALEAWASARGVAERVRIARELPEGGSGAGLAAIVVNAARDHERTVEHLIAAGIPTLVEKPLAFSGTDAERLASLARRTGVPLAAAHVFRFASYLERFADQVRSAGAVQSLEFEWSDPPAESRYGEAKRFDASVPVYADWLPHVVSIAEMLAPGRTMHLDDVRVRRGGAAVELLGADEGFTCTIRLARNAGERRRVLHAVTRTEQLRLDHSIEPGVLTVHGRHESADPSWGKQPGPLARMLSAFVKWVAGGAFVEGLELQPAIRAARLIEQASAAYAPQLSAWVAAQLHDGEVQGDDLRYALTERMLAEERLPEAEVDRRIHALLASRL